MAYPKMGEITDKFVGQPYDLNSVLSPAKVWEKLDAQSEEVRVFVNGLVDLLNSTGEDNWLYMAIASALLGQLTDGSLTDAKLSDAEGQIKDRLTTGLAGLTDELDTKTNQFYKTNAEQNIQLWELQAQVINDKESMLGWQGDGFFSNQNEIVDTPTNMTVLRGETLTDDTSRILFGNPDPDGWEALPDIATAGNATALDYSPNNKYLAVGVSSGYLYILKRDGEGYITVKSSSVVGVVKGVAFSPDSNYVAVSHTVSPYIAVFKQTSEDVFTALPAPGTLPTGSAGGVAFDQTGTYLAVGHAVTPFVTIYKRSEDTFNKIANPTSLPSDTAKGVSFGTDPVTGYTYLAVAVQHYIDSLEIFVRLSGDTFNNVGLASIGSDSAGISVSFTSDGVYLAFGYSLYPYCTVFKRTGDSTFTNLNPLGVSAATNVAVRFSPDGNYLIASNLGSSYARLYKRVGDAFTVLENSLSYSKNGGIVACAFTSDNSYVALGSGSYPEVLLRATTDEFLTPTSGNLITKSITLPEVSNSIFFLEESSMDAGVSLKYEVSLDGGTTWEEVTTFGEIVVLGHTGTELVIKASYTRDVSGVGEGYIEWFVCWGGVS